MKRFEIDEETVLRYAEEKDAPLVLEFVRALAEYEHLLDQVRATEDGLKQYLFADKTAEVIICEYRGVPAGYSLYFHNFSSFEGRPGIYIEDLFVKPEFRGKGLGKRLLAFIAGRAVERNCGRLEWACLNWNEPSIAFYKSNGARPLSEWTTYRVTGEKLRKLAGDGLGNPNFHD
ncbi:MAG: GNAT family N-acetyltransferase [Treponema sp.]|jgi:GNAT superfamily N-acetyltransferase|nr:GNAT family N-acetyltransferase [Treponema sp.]